MAILSKNKIETYDNLLMKIENPSYEGDFYNIQHNKKISYPYGIPTFGNKLYSS